MEQNAIDGHFLWFCILFMNIEISVLQSFIFFLGGGDVRQHLLKVLSLTFYKSWRKRDVFR